MSKIYLAKQINVRSKTTKTGKPYEIKSFDITVDSKPARADIFDYENLYQSNMTITGTVKYPENPKFNATIIVDPAVPPEIQTQETIPEPTPEPTQYNESEYTLHKDKIIARLAILKAAACANPGKPDQVVECALDWEENYVYRD